MSKILGWTIVIGVLILIGITILMTPIFWLPNYDNLTWVRADQNNLREHVKALTESQEERNHENIERLNEVATYIYNHFELSRCDTTRYQTYLADGSTYKNVICIFDGDSDETIVLGAHYDVDASNHDKEDIWNQIFQWADDNASWVAGLLELATMIKKDRRKQWSATLELVAYTLEEVPHYHTDKMWSYVHAKSLKQTNRDVRYMISLEMIWYFSDEKIQKYPVGALKFIYPKTGDFIALVGKLWESWWLRSIKKSFMSGTDISIYSMKAPSFTPAIDRSDHWSYWQHGYEAYILTDTSYLRNPHYHKVTDTIDTLNFDKMWEVVNGVYNVIIKS